MSCEDMDFPAVWPWAACAPKPARLEYTVVWPWGSTIPQQTDSGQTAIMREIRLLRYDLDQLRNEGPGRSYRPAKEPPAISPPSAVPQKGIIEAYEDESHVLS